MEIVERDEAGNVIATYLASEDKDANSRVNVILPKDAKKPWQRILDVFLPAGYPHSVTEDYTAYQIYDSLQAFSSSIAGLLASRAVLEGVGVGDASASPTAALLLSILQESTGRIATILFAHRLGTALEPECKMYRLAADVFNDAAMILDCLSPVFPKPIRVAILSLSSVLRALCGVAAGSAKASLSAHFARWGNLGELNAKDGSQETVISLLGMLTGSLVVSSVTSKMATWVTLMFLLTIHLYTNYLAVRAVSMRSLNQQRANIVLSHLAAEHVALTPQQVSQQERVFERDGVLRGRKGQIMGTCRIGVRLEELMHCLAADHVTPGVTNADKPPLTKLLQVFEEEPFVLWFSGDQVMIVVKTGATPRDALRAWLLALFVADYIDIQRRPGKKPMEKTDIVKGSLETIRATFHSDLMKLGEAGWDLDTAALETRSGTRCTCDSMTANSAEAKKIQ